MNTCCFSRAKAASGPEVFPFLFVRKVGVDQLQNRHGILFESLDIRNLLTLIDNILRFFYKEFRLCGGLGPASLFADTQSLASVRELLLNERAGSLASLAALLAVKSIKLLDFSKGALIVANNTLNAFDGKVYSGLLCICHAVSLHHLIRC
jgi:hypothetical protein